MAELRRWERTANGQGAAEPLDLAELRLLRLARHRDPAALAELWGRIVDDAWSVARALLDEDAAVSSLLETRDALVAGATGLSLDSRWIELPFGRLFAVLHQTLELPPLSGIDRGEWTLPGPLPDTAVLRRDPEAARRAVRFAPPALRLIYLFSLLTPCTLAGIGRMAGVAPAVVRQARAAVTWRVIRELQS